jgi:hypothetical protein
MMLCIPLFPLDCGLLALVDAKDFWTLADYEWHSFNGYACRPPIPRDGKPIYMHRQIMAAGDGENVDHVNGKPLDNRRVNLRVCSQQHNRQNSFKPAHRRGRPTTSRYKGVSLAVDESWQASASDSRGVRVSLGRHPTEEQAADAYDDYVRRVYGEFARVNFPRDGEQCALRSPVERELVLASTG